MSSCLKYVAYVSIWSVVFMLAGCVTRPLIDQTSPRDISCLEDHPWYRQVSGAYDTFDGRVFYGIGKAEGSRNTTLLRAAADNQARKEMAKVLDNYVADLFRSTGAMSALTMEEGEQMIGELVQNGIKKAVVSDHWSDSRQARLYALCRLKLDTFKQVLAAQTIINAKDRGAMWAEAESVHALMVENQSQP